MNKSFDQLCASCPRRSLTGEVKEEGSAVAPAPDETYVAPDCYFKGPAVVHAVGLTTVGEFVLLGITEVEVCGKEAEELLSRQRPTPPFPPGGPPAPRHPWYSTILLQFK